MRSSSSASQSRRSDAASRNTSAHHDEKIGQSSDQESSSSSSSSCTSSRSKCNSSTSLRHFRSCTQCLIRVATSVIGRLRRCGSTWRLQTRTVSRTTSSVGWGWNLSRSCIKSSSLRPYVVVCSQIATSCSNLSPCLSSGTFLQYIRFTKSSLLTCELSWPSIPSTGNTCSLTTKHWPSSLRLAKKMVKQNSFY